MYLDIMKHYWESAACSDGSSWEKLSESRWTLLLLYNSAALFPLSIVEERRAGKDRKRIVFRQLFIVLDQLLDLLRSQNSTSKHPILYRDAR
jgi:hypothetical protein